MAGGGNNLFYDTELSLLRIEVDGNVVFESAVGEMFDGTSIPLTSPAMLFSDGDPDCGRSRYGPVCARTRLRMAWSFTHIMEFSAVALLRHSDQCISDNTVCLVRNYNDVTFISALALPPHWCGTYNYLSGDAVTFAVNVAPTPLLTADDATEARALNAVSINHCQVSTADKLRRNADPRWVLPQPAAPTAAETSFVDAALNPHALMNGLAARAEQVRAAKRCSTLTGKGDSHEVFMAHGESGVLTGWRLSFPGASRAAGVNAPDLSFVGIWDGDEIAGGANFTSPLSLLFGPPARALAEDWGMPATNQPLAQLFFGSTTRNSSYWALPAPFRVSARVVVLLTGNRVLPLEVCSESFFEAGGDTSSSASAMNGNFFAGANAPVGYLRSVVYDFLLVKGTNVIADIVGVEGKLVAVTSFLGMRHGHTSVITPGMPSSAVEGDWLFFVDGSPAPSIWNTGFEDFFDSSHGFLARFVMASRPFAGHQRFSFPQGKYNHPEADLFGVRLLTLDAVPFRHSLRVLIEGFIHGDFSASTLLQGTLIFYGRTASVPPIVSDTVYAAVELDSASLPSGRPHAFAIEGDAAAFVRRYRLSSAVAGASLSLNAHAKNPSLQPPPGTPPPPTPLNTTYALDVLAIGHGALISFTIALAPDAQSVMLRRLVDLRYGVQRAVLHVDGRRVALLQSSDRAFTHIDAHWTSADTPLPPSLTVGKTSIRVTLEVNSDANINRTYPLAMLGEAWTEAKWEAVCFFDGPSKQ